MPEKSCSLKNPVVRIDNVIIINKGSVLEVIKLFSILDIILIQLLTKQLVILKNFTNLYIHNNVSIMSEINF